MTAGLPPERLPSAEERERTVRALCAHFADDRLSLEEFESRLDRSYRATTVAELDSLLADLPAAVPTPETAAIAPAAQVPERGVMVAFMGGHERRGTWTPPRRLYVVAVWGGAELDFREARLAPGLTEVTVLACMGGADIIVPPGVTVETNGMAIMGGFGQLAQTAGRSGPDAPVLRINGFALMGGVDVESRLPGESSRDARRRLREEREARRLGRGR